MPGSFRWLRSLLTSLADLVRAMNCYYNRGALNDLALELAQKSAGFRRSLPEKQFWSIARGLARNVESYKSHLTACDLTRRNDLDGRGHLSEENLAAFTSFFLTTCIDQVTFMEGLMQPDRLRARILLWAEEEIRLDKLVVAVNPPRDVPKEKAGSRKKVRAKILQRLPQESAQD